MVISYELEDLTGFDDIEKHLTKNKNKNPPRIFAQRVFILTLLLKQG